MGSSSSSSESKNSTTNTDNRMAVQDGVGVGAGATATINMQRADAEVLKTLAGTLPDAAVAMTNAGADVIQRAGDSVVNMTRDSIAANTKSFDSVVNFGAAAIDRLIDASTESGTRIAQAAISSYKPSDNSNADALKWGLIAAVGVAAAAILGKTK